jgi:hypothetical protein
MTKKRFLFYIRIERRNASHSRPTVSDGGQGNQHRRRSYSVYSVQKSALVCHFDLWSTVAKKINPAQGSPRLAKPAQATSPGRGESHVWICTPFKPICGYLHLLTPTNAFFPEKKDCLFFSPRRLVSSKHDVDGSFSEGGLVGWSFSGAWKLELGGSFLVVSNPRNLRFQTLLAKSKPNGRVS